MTVSTTTARNAYTASAAQTVFAYTFNILDEAHIAVYVDDVLQVISTDYTVSGVASGSGGNVTFLSGLAGGESVVLLRDVPLTQLTDYTAYDPFPAETHEAALDYLMMALQQVDERIDRMPIMPPSASAASPQFPTPGAGMLIRWNAAGTALEAVAMADLSLAIDTVLTAQAAQDMLVWDGTQWVNRKRVTSAERTAGTETEVRSMAPADIASMVATHAPAPPVVSYQSGAKGLLVLRGSNSEVTVTADEVIFDDGQVVNGVNVTIDITAAAQKNGRGDSVSESTSTWYYICLSHDNGTVYGWLDTDSGGANDPDATDDAFYYAGAIYNDSSGHLVNIFQVGNYVRIEDPQAIVSSGTATSFTLTAAAEVPPHIRVIDVMCEMSGGVTAQMQLSEDGSTVAYNWQDTASGDSNKTLRGSFTRVPCTAAQKVYYQKLSTATGVTVAVAGYPDHKIAA